jgi:hypothetical protein
VRYDASVHHSTIEPALNGNDFAFDDRIRVFPARSQVDERAAAAVVKNELVAEDIGDAALHGNIVSVLQLADRGRLQQHDALRLPALGDFHTAGAGRGANQQDGQRDASQPAAVPRLSACKPRRVLILWLCFVHRTLLLSVTMSET